MRELTLGAQTSLPPLLDALIAGREPVLLHGFLDQTPLATANSAKAACRLIGDTALSVKEEYIGWIVRNLASNQGQPLRTETLRSYLALLDADPKTRLMCTEHPTPADLVAQLGAWPDALRRHGEPSSFSFVGGAGRHAHMHYDGDYRCVLLVQIFGHKNAVLVSPQHSALLRSVGNFAGLYLDRMSQAQRADFCRLTEAHTATLCPGDALFMPAALWHFMNYPDTGMSINLRFGSSPVGQRLAGKIHLHDALQQLVWHFADHHPPTASEAQFVDELLDLAGSGNQPGPCTAAALESLILRFLSTLRSPPEWPCLDEADAIREPLRAGEFARLYPARRPGPRQFLHGWQFIEQAS